MSKNIIEKKTKNILNEISKLLYKKMKNNELYNYIEVKFKVMEIKSIKIEKDTNIIEINGTNDKFTIQFLPNIVNTDQIIIIYESPNFIDSKNIKYNKKIVKVNEKRIIKKGTSVERRLETKEYKENVLIYKKLTISNLIGNRTINKICFEAHIYDDVVLATKFNESIDGTYKKYFMANEVLKAKFKDDKKSSFDTLLENFLFLYINNFECGKEEYEKAYFDILEKSKNKIKKLEKKKNDTE